MPTAVKSGDKDGSTYLVKREPVILRYSYKGTEYTRTRGAGGAITVAKSPKTFVGDVTLYYAKKLIDFFNIPTYSGGQQTIQEGISDSDFYTVEAFTRERFAAIDGSGTQISVRKHMRARPDNSSLAANRRRPAIIRLGDRKTAKGTPRTITLSFPLFFNGIMISQAIGSMMANATPEKKPIYWYTEAKNAHRVIYGVTGVIPVADCGAWLTNAYGSDPGDKDVGVLSSAGDLDTQGTATP